MTLTRALRPLLLLFLLLTLVTSGCRINTAEAGDRRMPSYDAAMATYKIMAYDSNPLAWGEPMWSGTAWKLSDTEMVTAGHVCDTQGLKQSPWFRVYNDKGQSWPATVIAWENDAGIDLCVVSASPPGPVMKLAPDMPAYDAELYYVGAPHGLWEDGMMPVYHGRYAGGQLAVIGGAPGASGSAILSDNGVVGVLVAGIASGNLVFFVPVHVLKWFLDKNGI